MSLVEDVEAILARARELEKEYDWLGAAGSYKKALGLVSENDSSKIGEVHESSGYALFHAALQAESPDELKARIRGAVEDHEKAREFYRKQGEPGGVARALRCDAMIA